MSSTKMSKSTSKDDKDIVVSFASDSDDDESSTASNDNSDSDVIKPGKSPAATNAGVTSEKQKASKQVEPDLDAADQQPSRKQVTPPSNEEKPASKTTKSKSKESSKSTSQANENGTDEATNDKTNKSDEPKTVKKKKVVKGDLTAVNGDSKPEDASEEVKRKPTENSEPTEVGEKKKSTKTTKKTSKAVDKIENVDADSATTDKKSKSVDEITSSVVMPSATAVETDDSSSKPLKKTKKSTKTSLTTVNGECEKIIPTEVPTEKSSEKKLLKKSKETVEDINSTTVGALDAAKKETNEKTVTDNIPKQTEEEASSAQTDTKVKPKKKKEKTGDVKVENDQPAEPEITTVTAEDVSTSGKVVKKKKVKKVASTDTPIEIPAENAGSLTPSITIETADAIEKLDLDADREVQLICDSQLETAAATSADYVRSTDQEMPAVATESKSTELSSAPAFVAINEGNEDNEIKLQEKSSPPDDTKLSVLPGNQADDTGSYITPLKEHTHDSSSPLIGETLVTTSKDENKEYLTISEGKISSADVSQEEGKTRDNEESDYSYRRKSMDDFIKRILAEAREEQQKKMNAVQPSQEDSSSSLLTAAEINTESDQSPHKSNNGQELTSEVGIDKDDLSLDRGLTFSDRKRGQPGYPSIDLEDKKSSLSTDTDLDDDLAQIKGYFSRRGQTSLSKLDPMNDITNSTERNRSALDDGEDISIARKVLKDVLPEDSGTFLTRFRQTERGETIADDDYAPKRREETTEIVRSSTKPVRSVIDQQTEVIQQLKTTSRSIDELENEIRALRETFLDRQARIDSLRRAIDAESRMYEAEQTAANDRIQQQKIPGGRFVRDEFLASFTPRGETSLRSRSGSISSLTGLVTGSLSVGGGINEPISLPRAASLKPLSVTADSQRLQLGDTDDNLSTASGYSPGRFRRGGSVARERTYTMEEMLGGTGGYGISSSTSRASGLASTDVPAGSTVSSSTWSSYSTSASPEVTRQYQPGTSYSSSYTRRFQNDSNDFRSPSSYTPISAYGDSGRTSSQYLSGLRFDRPYVRDSTSPSPSVSSSYSLTSSGSTIDPSRFRRAQSVFDVSSNYDSSSSFVSTPGSAIGGGGGGEFQSRFLDKVRGKKSFDDAKSGSGSGQFKSRFLRSNFDSSSKKY